MPRAPDPIAQRRIGTVMMAAVAAEEAEEAGIRAVGMIIGGVEVAGVAEGGIGGEGVVRRGIGVWMMRLQGVMGGGWGWMGRVRG